MSRDNWPPPIVAVTYVVRDCGNGVIRIEGAQMLDEPPKDTSEAHLMVDCPALEDALHVLGIPDKGQWASQMVDSGDGWMSITSWRLAA